MYKNGQKSPQDARIKIIMIDLLSTLQEAEALPGQVASSFTLHVNFRGQRFKSRPTPCACEPDLQEGFLLELHKEAAGLIYSKTCAEGILTKCPSITGVPSSQVHVHSNVKFQFGRQYRCPFSTGFTVQLSLPFTPPLFRGQLSLRTLVCKPFLQNSL